MSDIDLMLIGEGLNYGDVMDVLIPLEESLQRPLNPTIYTSAEFKSKLDQSNSFLVRVMEQPRIMIRGAIDDFGKSGTNQTTQP